MLSSADLHFERALILTALILFLGAGFSCMFIINSVKKKQKNILYYVLSFLVSGIIVLALVTFCFYTMLIE
ncbi:hypothetical protein EG359_01855 [Chryseobacterium joostei]|uniref:Uncharacterized protein n=1 Tax=Chryseobacterium joostei TaxID=112234 RepID=A0A1N7IP98_9FLAO|nr:hypothetical protein EG359_01855 [Chryseobacterium joostei]SIS38811.1 hypothetical protein SAMN05421768_106157 [Chryseobacterium joostei]